MKEKIKNILLYGGLNKEKNEEYKTYILKQDVKNLTYYFVIAGALFLVLGIASLFSSGFAHINTALYLITAASFLVVLLLQRLTIALKGRSTNIHRIYVYLFMLILYSESIAVTVMHKSDPAVTFIGVLLTLPLLFAQYPLPMIGFQCTFAVVFCVFSACFKNPDASAIDIWNVISFLFVSIVEIVLVTPMRFNQIVQPEVIRKLGEMDMLTGVKNRNTFETFCDSMRKEKTNIICVYVDVNGLHEMNNEHGHEAGDNMLKAIAKEMAELFDKTSVYRIGGDEFVAFSIEKNVDLISHNVAELKKKMEELGYFLSVGYSFTENNEDKIDEIIKRAESKMYDDKKIYYSNVTRERRRG